MKTIDNFIIEHLSSIDERLKLNGESKIKSEDLSEKYCMFSCYVKKNHVRKRLVELLKADTDDRIKIIGADSYGGKGMSPDDLFICFNYDLQKIENKLSRFSQFDKNSFVASFHKFPKKYRTLENFEKDYKSQAITLQDLDVYKTFSNFKN